MEVHFFAKEVPQTAIFLSNGRKLQFDFVDPDVGFTMTQDPGMVAQLNSFISQRIGGIRPATKDEYDDFLKKKSSSPNLNGRIKPPWREEIKPGQPIDPGAVAVVARTTTIQSGQPVSPPAQEPVAAPTDRPVFKPKTTKRK